LVEKEIGTGGSKITENTVALAVAGLAQMVFALVQLGILSRFLDGEIFGTFVVLKGFSLLLATVILVGLPQVLIRFLPSFQSGGRWKGAVGSFALFTSIVMLLGLILFLTSQWWSVRIPGAVRGVATSGSLIYWLVLASTAIALRLLLYGGFNGLREMKMQMFFELLYQTLMTAFLLALRGRLGVALLFKAMFAFNMLVFLTGSPILVILIRRIYLRGRMQAAEGVVRPSIAGYWGSALVLSLAGLAFTDVDRFVMSTLLTVSAISVYHVASRINQLVKRFLGFPVIALQPELTRVYEEGRWDELAGRIFLFTKAVMVTALMMIALTAAVGRELIILVSGEEYSGAYVILLALLPTVVAASLVAPLTTAMRALHYIKWAVLCDFVWMAFYFAGLAVLIPRIGLLGTAVAQLIASSAQIAVAVILSRREGFYRNIGGWIIIRFTAAAVVFAALGALVSSTWGLAAAAACIVLAPAIFRMMLRMLSVFEEEEAKAIISMVPSGRFQRLIAWALSTEI
jgi:O-antigen/teichoic acid export membrane protein